AKCSDRPDSASRESFPRRRESALSRECAHKPETGRMSPMYRADHVGSLLRPKELKDAFSNSSLTTAQRTEIENEHIIAALARQKDLGFKIFTDGELRRRGFMTDFYDSVDGLNMDRTIERTWQGGAPTARLYGVVTDRVRQKRRLAKHEVDFLRSN